jgi:3-hydroxyacyl-CoA dehydrogenase/enoyl-CoA hydratase/3-hydroxybutyryl-CoA epimerase
MLAEGVHPQSLERAATQAGYPVGPLQLTDELNMELMLKIAKATADAAEREGFAYTEHPGSAVVQRMVELGRPSRLKGAGFYEYDENGARAGIWKGLVAEYPTATDPIPFQDVKDRMLFAEALETAKCFDEGVLTSSAAANIGSIMGIGFPPNTGGAAQFMTGYEAASGEIGPKAFVARADELAAAYGDRFRPTAYLRDLAAQGGTFPT